MKSHSPSHRDPMDGHGGGAPPRYWVFTDLDGTLLDHDTYDCAAARPALEALGREGMPVVLCSSKTRAELVALQKRLGIAGPVIAENGGGVFLPAGGDLAGLFPDRRDGVPAKVLGVPYEVLRTALIALREELGLGLVGFGDVGVDEVVRWTGLGPEDAELARRRDFDEPFRWEPEPGPELAARVRNRLEKEGLLLTRGGRFWHLIGPSDKGRAVCWLLDGIRRARGGVVRSLGLGDSENDLPMLLAVERGVLVERPGGGHLAPCPAGIGTVAGIGPAGWARAVFDWMRDLKAAEPLSR